MIRPTNTQVPNAASNGNPSNPLGLGSPAGTIPRPRVRRGGRVRVRR